MWSFSLCQLCEKDRRVYRFQAAMGHDKGKRERTIGFKPRKRRKKTHATRGGFSKRNGDLTCNWFGPFKPCHRSIDPGYGPCEMFSSGCTEGLDPCPSETGLSKLGVMWEPFSQYYWLKLGYLKVGYQCDVSEKLGYLKLGYQSEIVCCFWPKIIDYWNAPAQKKLLGNRLVLSGQCIMLIRGKVRSGQWCVRQWMQAVSAICKRLESLCLRVSLAARQVKEWKRQWFPAVSPLLSKPCQRLRIFLENGWT